VDGDIDTVQVII